MRKLLALTGLVAAMGLAVGTAGAGAGTVTDVATLDGQIMSSIDAAALGLPTTDVPATVVNETYSVSDDVVTTVADPADAPPGNFKTTFWGYEAAAANARIRSYSGYPTAAVPGPQCVPTLSGGAGQTANGRGMAFDPLTADLWITRLNGVTFTGDGKVYLVLPPQLDPKCQEVTEIVVHANNPHDSVQDDFGAVDVDEATKHLWLAGYKPISKGGVLRSYFYLVNRNNGLVLHSCWIPFRGGGVGNDTLAVYRNPSLPGSSKYFITDAGEIVTTPNTLAVIDQSDCHNGNQVTPVAEVPKTNPMAGIDVEWGGMLSTTNLLFFNNGDFPFAPAALVGSTAGSALEDISVCGFRGEVGGDGNDFCPYP